MVFISLRGFYKYTEVMTMFRSFCYLSFFHKALTMRFAVYVDDTSVNSNKGKNLVLLGSCVRCGFFVYFVSCIFGHNEHKGFTKNTKAGQTSPDGNYGT